MIENKNNINDAPLSRETNKVHYLKNFGQSTQEDNRYILMHTVLFDMNYGTFNNCTVVENSLPSTIPTKITENGSIKLHVVPDTGYKLTNDCFTITNATYNYADGYLTISNPTGDVSVNANAEDAIDYLCITLTDKQDTNSVVTVFFDKNNEWYSPDASLMYSTNKEDWYNFSRVELTNIGDKVYFKGDNTTIGGSVYYNHFYASSISTFSLSVSGDITTIISKQGNVLDLSTYSNNIFSNVFCGSYFSNVENLKLPSTILSKGCYCLLFANNTKITKSPDISAANSLAESCFSGMFSGCTALVNPPSLPASTLATYCYQNMFSGCTSLTTAPSLPANTLANYCYNTMFEGCTNLTIAPTLNATTLATGCYSGMFKNCTSLVNIPNLPATTLQNNCYENMFMNCTSIISGPIEINTLTVPDSSCKSMFYGCTSLVNAPKLIATTIGYDSYAHMFNGCTSLVNAPAIYNTSFLSSTIQNCSMFKGCTNLTSIPEFSGLGNISELFYGCSKIKMSSTYTSTYKTTYILPVWGSSYATNIFYGTGGSFTGTPTIGAIYTQNKIVYSYERFNICAEQANCTVTITEVGDMFNVSLEYSYDGINWTNYILNTTLNISNNKDKIYFRGDNNTLYIDSNNYCRFTFTGKVSVNGDITNLINRRNSVYDLSSYEDYTFAYLFYNCTNISSVENLILPTETLIDYCYYHMFDGCTLITKAPQIDALTLSAESMAYMFNGCVSLNYIEAKFTNWYLDANATVNWLLNVSSSGTFRNPEGLSIEYNNNQVPSNWSLWDGYLCFTATEDSSSGYVRLGYYKYDSKSYLPSISLKYSNDLITWKTFTSSTYYYMKTAGTKMYIKGNNLGFGNHYNSYADYYYTFYASQDGKFKLSGDITTIINERGDIKDLWPYSKYYAFYKMFQGSYVDISTDFKMPSQRVLYGYSYMFNNSHITTLPDLSALSESPYSDNYLTSMFEGCAQLTTVSNIPKKCTCTNMFKYCTGITTISPLPSEFGSYSGMFYGCTGITTVPTNLLPAMNLPSSAYYQMFYDCTNLTNTPNLPATTLSERCYSYMFGGCQKLTTLPTLPSTSLVESCYQGMFSQSGITSIPDDYLFNTTLADYCYQSMFESCNITTLPKISATSLAVGCYSYMFYGCNSLTTIPSNYLPLTDMHKNCYFAMFEKCKSLINTPDLPAIVLAESCYGEMFSWCTSLKTASALTATTTAESCYESMFANCTALTTMPTIAATTLSLDCYRLMFDGCTSLSTLANLPATTLANCCYELMFRGCTALVIPNITLQADILTNSCYHGMFYNCTSLTTAPALPATTLAQNCYNQMFYGCTSLTTAPALPATDLADYCYQYMFYGCTALTTASALPATTLANYCYQLMFSGCTSLVNAPSLPATNLTKYCYYGMFTGCTNLGGLNVSFTDWNTSNYSTTNWVLNVVTFIKSFNAPSELSKIYDNSHIPTRWEPPTSDNFLCFTAISENSTIDFSCTSSSQSIAIQYTNEISDNTTWIPYTLGTTITLSNVGDKVYFYGANSAVATSSWRCIFHMTGSIAASGDVTTLMSPKGNILTLTNTYTFSHLFYNCTSLTSAPELVSTTLSQYCYNYMFYGCTSLITMPTLPATTLANYCYSYMFSGCTALMNVSTLPAMTLTSYCYSYMFDRCTSLENMPTLPATTLATYCYQYMFNSCTNLTNVVNLPAITLASYCYSHMFMGCSNMVITPKILATTLASECCWGMFYNCTSLTETPELSATKMATDCYLAMFYNCTALVTAIALPATTLATACYKSMFYGCTNLTTIPKLGATKLYSNCYQYMFYGCSKIKISTTYDETEYPNTYSFGTTPSTSYANYMFTNTGGTYSGAATKQTYYTSNTIIE